ncbi:uncharacterized protein LOC132726147 [Ruditapes philippinarum]|uniref:uncharacterized protein LOC132726147 n=1 Tax=Ruditapes philippinarum TaxID=129788 RepID=UPI00295AB41D|nr:uncharacterized protein LOC132726147 [Ruditapes philippinarum]
MSRFFISMPIISSKLHDLESRPTIVEIANGADPNQMVKPDIEDDQKRWLIVGICLHSVLSPVLRKYIPPVVSNLYSQLKRSDQIDNQKYPNQLARYKPTNKELNYEAINNNAVIPQVSRRKDEKNFNYDVKCDVDLSKLFMPTSMTQYTGFDDTCDTSALLGIIINIFSFPALVKTVAEQVHIV